MGDGRRIVFIGEGDAESWKGWSGSSFAIVSALRRRGYHVDTINVIENRWLRHAALALGIAPSKARWIARYHFGPAGFRIRTATAVRRLRAVAPDIPIIQVGATFDADPTGERRVFVHCDANVRTAMAGRPYSQVSPLHPAELEGVIERETSVYRHAAGIFTFSGAVRDSFVEAFGVPADRVHVVLGGANLDTIPDVARLDRPLPADPTVLFVGRKFERKGGPDLVAAFPQVRAAVPRARLIIAGCRPAMSLPEGVEAIGFVAKDGDGESGLTRLFLGADVYCMPSRYEPFGVVFLEAMLHGVPCIGADAWAMPEIIDHGATGWLVPIGNPDALAAQLIDALADRNALREMGRRGRERVLERFTWDKVAERMADAIEGATVGT